MKKMLLPTILCSSILGFSSQVFAVAVTASGTALENTKKIVRDCSRTKDKNVLYRCEVAKYEADLAKAEKDAEDEAKAKQNKAALIGAGLTAAGSLAGFIKDRKGSGPKESSDVKISDRDNEGESSVTIPIPDRVTTPSSSTATTSTLRPTARPTVTQPPSSTIRPSARSSAHTKTSSGSRSQQLADVSSDEDESKHKCKNFLTTQNINGACKGANLKIDVSNKCMCVGIHCFDIKIEGIRSPELSLVGNSTLTSQQTNQYSFGIESGGRRVDISRVSDDTAKSKRGVQIPAQAFPFIEKAVQDARADSSLVSMKVCRDETPLGPPGTAASSRGSQQRTSRPTMISSTSSISRGGRASVPQRVSSKLTKRMDHAIKVRNQYAPVPEADSIY